jgi:hypothetical protein
VVKGLCSDHKSSQIFVMSVQPGSIAVRVNYIRRHSGTQLGAVQAGWGIILKVHFTISPEAAP